MVGAKPKLKAYLASNAPARAGNYALKKAWLDDILAGLRLGGAYAFDEEAYQRFYPLAQAAGQCRRRSGSGRGWRGQDFSSTDVNG